MNKKVLSAILFSALFAGTGTFTSCIDNDEPAGIEELRGAKAELIRAKVAVEQANAAFTLAQAEVEKAKAAKELAEAKIKEAVAKIKEAEAEAQKIQNDADRADLEKKIAEYEMELEKAAAKHEAAMLEKQVALAKAKRSYDIAMKQIAIAEALMSEEVKVAVSELKAAVNWWMAEVETLEHNIEKQQDVLYDAAKYLTAKTDLKLAQAEADLNAAKAALEANELAIEKYQSYLAVDSTTTAADWRAEVAAIEAEVLEFDKKIATYELEFVKAMESEETKALKAAVDAAEDAKDAIEAPELAEKLTYTYKYLGTDQDVTKTIENVTYEDAISEIAGSDFLTTGEYAGFIAELKNDIDSYTTEKKYWLDSIADMDATAEAAASELAEKVKKNYEEALAAWTNAYSATEWAAKKTAAGTAVTTYKQAIIAIENPGVVLTPNNLENIMSLSVANYNKVITAVTNLKTALVTYYTAGAKMNMQYNKVALPNYNAAGVITGYTSKTIKEWLSADGVDNLIAIINNAENGVDYVINEGVESVSVPASGNIAAYTTSYKRAIKSVANAADLKTALEAASEVAFGNANNYSDTSLDATAQNGYLHNIPGAKDVKFIEANYGLGAEMTKTIGSTTYTYYANVGIYGFSLLGKDVDVQFVAKNYEAIIADYEAAIEYWTAAVEEMVEGVTEYTAEVEAADAAILAATEAYNEHVDALEDKFNEDAASLRENIASLNRVKLALITAVDTFLADEYTKNYNGEANFMKWLAKKLENAQEGAAQLEYNVAEAEIDLQAIKDGKFDEAHKVAKEQEKLAKLEEDLANAVAELQKAIEDLATAQEIWAE